MQIHPMNRCEHDLNPLHYRRCNASQSLRFAHQKRGRQNSQICRQPLHHRDQRRPGSMRSHPTSKLARDQIHCHYRHSKLLQLQPSDHQLKVKQRCRTGRQPLPHPGQRQPVSIQNHPTSTLAHDLSYSHCRHSRAHQLPSSVHRRKVRGNSLNYHRRLHHQCLRLTGSSLNHPMNRHEHGLN